MGVSIAGAVISVPVSEELVFVAHETKTTRA